MEKIDVKLIEELMNQVSHLEENMLYAGLTVIAKDTAEFLAAKGRYDGSVANFYTIYGEMMDDERKYWEAYGSPLYDTLSESGLPQGFIKEADSGHAALMELTDQKIMHEWTLGPGTLLMKKFSSKFRDVICKGKDSIYVKLENGLLGQADLPKSIVASILTAGFSAATFWYPIAVYLSLLLLKTGVKTYCETS